MSEPFSETPIITPMTESDPYPWAFYILYKNINIYYMISIATLLLK
jgi:hypothetical protein